MLKQMRCVELLQELSLEENEAQLAEKKAALNKKAEEKKVDLGDFKGMSTYVRKTTEEVITGVEITKKKEAKEEKAKEEAEKEAKKKVCRDDVDSVSVCRPSVH